MAGYLFDTNILLRLTRRRGASHFPIEQTITRLVDRNGFGVSIGEADEEVRLIEPAMSYFPTIIEFIGNGGDWPRILRFRAPGS